MRDRRVFILRVLLQSLCHAKISVDRVRVNFEGMFKVLHSSLPFRQVCQEIRKVNARSEVVLVDLQTLLIVEQALFVLFNQLIGLANVEKSACLGSLYVVPHLHVERLFQYLEGFLSFLVSDQNLTLEKKRFNGVCLDSKGLVYDVQSTRILLLLLE